ncbi:gamma-glutamylcyclotransferase family protein [Sphingobium aromaticiconvertens]|uniref:gamma-glutamylcyclotransferase family protein n=1 Tax=Sphingobium aromaticiconvertens TaxID=365341 RepID=UPI003018E54F
MVLLFVYGTLRVGFDGPMARWLRGVAQAVGQGHLTGCLYCVDDYPAFVPGEAGCVTGDLFALRDPAMVLAKLDDYEQCSEWPQPHEYRRERVMVMTSDGPFKAWAYIYADDTSGLPLIVGGDFLH